MRTVTRRKVLEAWAGAIAVALMVSAASCCHGMRPASPERRSVGTQYDTVTAVMVVCPDYVGFGSAVVVGPGHLVTADHVIACRGEVSAVSIVVMWSDLELPARVSKRDTPGDLARLSVDGDPFPFGAPELAPPPPWGDDVCAVMATPGIGRHCGQVQFSSRPAPGDIVHDATIEHGNSGGPVYDLRGRLVGITTHLMLCGNGQICGGRATGILARDWIMPETGP